jgi:predicted nucleic acid-binding protein
MTRYLADASVLTRLSRADVAEFLAPLLEAGYVGTCGVVDLRLHATIRELKDLPAIAALRMASFAWLTTEDRDLRRAIQVQAQLAETGQRLTDWSALVVAAVAERHQVTVLHHHPDFDLIGKLTGQETQWVVPER